MRHVTTRIDPATAAVGVPVLASALVLSLVSPGAAQTAEWPSYAADQAGTKYSALDQINAETVGDVEIVWRQPVIPDAIRDGDTTRGPVGSQTTPLMAGGMLYLSTGLGTIAALEPTTGEVIWNTGPSDGVRVRQTRGVAWWDRRRGSAGHRGTLGPKLVSLDARTGQRGRRLRRIGRGGSAARPHPPVPGLLLELGPRSLSTTSWSSAPTSRTSPTNQRVANKESTAGRRARLRRADGRAPLDVPHHPPGKTSSGSRPWGVDPVDDRVSWEYSGNTNMWAHPTGGPGARLRPISRCRRRPTTTTAGTGPADNLFAESLVLRRRADRRAHLALPGHPPRGLGDYDFASSRRAGGHQRRRTAHQGGSATEQAGLRLRPRPAPPASRSGRSRSCRSRGPTCPDEQLSPTQALPHQAAAVRVAGRNHRRPHRLHARVAAGGHRDPGSVRLGGRCFTAPIVLDPSSGAKQGDHLQPRHGGRCELERGRVRSRDRPLLYVPSAYSQKRGRAHPVRATRAPTCGWSVSGTPR